MNKNTLNKLFRSAAVGISCFIVTVVLYSGGAFDFFENKTYDIRMSSTAPGVHPSDEIMFIKIDQQSVDWAKENKGWGWPWPREAYANLIDFISAGKAESIAFDLFFTEESVYGPEDDEKFGEAERKSGRVIQTIFITDDGTGEQVNLPVPAIKDKAALLGNITSFMDKDDIIRRGRLSFSYDGTVYPSLGTAPLVLSGREDLVYSVPRLKDGTFLIRYPVSTDAYNPYPAYKILESYDAWINGEEGFFVPEDFEGEYVFVGLYGPGFYDVCSTPVSQVYPGVGVHIATLDNILRKNFIRKAPLIINLLWILLFCLLSAATVYFSDKFHSQRKTVIFIVIVFTTGIVLSIALPFLLFVINIWILMVPSVFAFILSFLICLGLSLSIEGKQKRFIKAAFSQCLSKDVVNEILNDPASFTLGGKEFNMSAIFTDIQKFSSFSELLTPSELGSLLNYYLTAMSEIIIEEHGTVDKYEGDAIVALVGAPLAMEDHAQRAVSAAIKMKKAEKQLNEEILQIAANEKPDFMDEDLYSSFKKMVASKKTIFTRIGINSGEMIAGYFGSENKKNYTMMGNNVNLASRLEGVNKQYHTNGILISGSTKDLLSDRFIVRSLDRVQVVNVTTPVCLYEVICEKSEASEIEIAYYAKWEKAMGAFAGEEYAQCLEILKALQQQKKEDGVAAYYIDIIEKFFIKGIYPKLEDKYGVEYNPENPADMNPEWIGTSKEIKGTFKLLQK